MGELQDCGPFNIFVEDKKRQWLREGRTSLEGLMEFCETHWKGNTDFQFLMYYKKYEERYNWRDFDNQKARIAELEAKLVEFEALKKEIEDLKSKGDDKTAEIKIAELQKEIEVLETKQKEIESQRMDLKCVLEKIRNQCDEANKKTQTLSWLIDDKPLQPIEAPKPPEDTKSDQTEKSDSTQTELKKPEKIIKLSAKTTPDIKPPDIKPTETEPSKSEPLPPKTASKTEPKATPKSKSSCETV